ncbi:MAG: 30S ribosomal protein S1, partial [Acidobacteriota bacterium]|nr:30S ribosomal protein S1 [Acidobacteriota bacterium]
ESAPEAEAASGEEAEKAAGAEAQADEAKAEEAAGEEAADDEAKDADKAEAKAAADDSDQSEAQAAGGDDKGDDDQPPPIDLDSLGPDDELEFEDFARLIDESMHNLVEGEIVTGRVINITDDAVVVDVGYKSEGLIPIHEFRRHDGEVTVELGDEVEVLLEKTEDQEGHVLLSRQKAERMRRWNEVEKAYKDNAIIQGRVIDRIKGGLTVDVGLRAFLPGSLVDIKPVKNLEQMRGRELEFKVISLDRRRNNIVLSRKAVLEKEFAKKKAETLKKLVEGARIEGVVKNITDYGVFIDLGGIDGLLHITDISWGRVNHPSEHFSVGDEVEIVVLKFDPETERVSLGYKQKSEDPWNLVDKKYPIGSRVDGRVVSLVDYGAFVEIEEGVEGLIHVSEMSWTKKVVNPSKILSVGDEVQAIVSELDMGQRRISLSLRQTERNPWEELADTFPEGSIIEGKVRNLTDFGAFVEITEGIDGLIHVSDMSWTKRVKHPSEVLKKGETVKARITNIDTQNQRISLSIKEFRPNEWQDFVDSHHVGDIVEGRVVNTTDFGLFVDIYEGLEGLVHISETDVNVAKLEDYFRVGDWVRARILRIEETEKKVGLTMRGVPQPTPEEIEELEAADKDEDEESDEAAAEETTEAAAEEDSDAAEESSDEAEEAAAEDASEEATAEETTEAAAEESSDDAEASDAEASESAEESTDEDSDEGEAKAEEAEAAAEDASDDSEGGSSEESGEAAAEEEKEAAS